MKPFSQIKTGLYRAGTVALTRYEDDRLDLQAMSLTYTTLLSLVPLLAVMFSVLKAFGVQNSLEPLLDQLLRPLGPESAEITERVTRFVGNMRVGILGAAGLAFLFYTVVSLVGKIEDALNQIWRAPRSRSWGQRVTTYLSVVLVGPVMVFTAFGLTASAQSYWLFERLTEIRVLSDLFTLLTRIMPFVLLTATFTLLYKLLPYTRVRLSSALIGGVTAGVLWQLVGTAFAAFVANSSRYAAIYSSFAVVVVFLIWLYVGWLIVLVGAEIAYLHQHPHAFMRESERGTAGLLFQEWLAFAALVEITRAHLSRRGPYQPAELASRLGVGIAKIENLIDDFVRAGILLKAAEPEGVALARSSDMVTAKEILDVVRGTDIEEIRAGGAVADLLVRQDRAVAKAMEGMTLRTLASDSEIKTLPFPQSQAHRAFTSN
ncbi:MAG: YihY/virulence factor BrkB family protein [Candidatus Binatia bacterium]